eukprot:CAMPEP_0206213498 /NCGR_PEP_ID=MMETSP0047_2-20121206/1157_1 /ASSEMBLY_ACC=CAM_ASM_000192 /TAXON_ID=195065 /ORGANISM="Chroomonas mesostigmatica_cf, Strain CCMP1168" /LENGTH=168 /DNA_ID=CAMNT_0053635657 /DNA_START=7 /DNA_END=513 /DNA_ORIENTATION=-
MLQQEHQMVGQRVLARDVACRQALIVETVHVHPNLQQRLDRLLAVHAHREHEGRVAVCGLPTQVRPLVVRVLARIARVLEPDSSLQEQLRDVERRVTELNGDEQRTAPVNRIHSVQRLIVVPQPPQQLLNQPNMLQAPFPLLLSRAHDDVVQGGVAILVAQARVGLVE